MRGAYAAFGTPLTQPDYVFVVRVAQRSGMWESRAVSIPGAHLSDLGYHEVRPGELDGQALAVVCEDGIESRSAFDRLRERAS